MDTLLDTPSAFGPLSAAPEQVADCHPAATSFVMRGDRRICYADYGDRDGFPVIALHGTPGSRLKYSVAHDEAARLGLRLISPDRWGYGQTDPHPQPSIAGYAAELGALADRLGLGRFALIGLSGGAPFAAATAAMLGPRVTKLALVSPLGPIHGTPADSLRPFHRFCFGTLPQLPGAATLVFRFYRRLLLVIPNSAIRLASVASVPVDKRVIRQPEVRDRLVAAFREGLAHGARGATLDLRLFAEPWSFAVSSIQAPTRMWLGTADRNVPQSAVTRLAAEIPGAELTMLPGEGHFWISRHYGEVLDWLRLPAVAASTGDRLSA